MAVGGRFWDREGLRKIATKDQKERKDALLRDVPKLVGTILGTLSSLFHSVASEEIR
jgi:hypothetical protein